MRSRGPLKNKHGSRRHAVDVADPVPRASFKSAPPGLTARTLSGRCWYVNLMRVCHHKGTRGVHRQRRWAKVGPGGRFSTLWVVGLGGLSCVWQLPSTLVESRPCVCEPGVRLGSVWEVGPGLLLLEVGQGAPGSGPKSPRSEMSSGLGFGRHPVPQAAILREEACFR